MKYDWTRRGFRLRISRPASDPHISTVALLILIVGFVSLIINVAVDTYQSALDICKRLYAISEARIETRNSQEDV